MLDVLGFNHIFHVCKFRNQTYYINRILKLKSSGVTEIPSNNEQKAVIIKIFNIENQAGVQKIIILEDYGDDREIQKQNTISVFKYAK